ncbi:MAG TPA: energy-coupling factor transporter transmembrane component T [Bacillota bacterium]|nr:energy-coupling factor transporter transmembrane component T [Bacillota bacterium]HPF42023.1 energy-coupling factor transporter transmembrane component T [Bacillota bacterium]HPJ85903.1 energy-coupling factor transporter transmembrane component T [Bacillota bacterium]HPQ61797.1 energy-coupling factor transporter transmembrane component T [Bacillota bacterium]HRX91226.1 energy-coupling factor transporter transmembrane component T [Candidatus Izemoplasmatales bacterium]
MKGIVIGQYIPGTGFFYKLDPRTKIAAVVILMVAVFLLETIPQLLIALGLSIVLLLWGKISVGRVLRGLKPLLVLMIFTFFFQVLFNTEGTVIWQTTFYFSASSMIALGILTFMWRIIAKNISGFKFIVFVLYLALAILNFHYMPSWYQFGSWDFIIYSKGLEMSVFVVVRLLIIITFSTVLTLTTKPTDLTQGLEKMMRPLKHIGINSDEFALIISISLRFIPTIFDEAMKIMAAQASRGADFSQGKLKDKVKQIVSLLVPMFIIAIKRSEDLADAMESRNFVPGKPRTRIYELAYKRLDLFAGLFIVLCLAGSIVLKVLI